LKAFISIKSITPEKVSAAQIGYCIATTFSQANLFLIVSIDISKSAPILSILFTNAILGTEYLSACFQTVSD
jgi:hypothetical protein